MLSNLLLERLLAAAKAIMSAAMNGSYSRRDFPNILGQWEVVWKVSPMGGRTFSEPKFSPTCRPAHLLTCRSFRLGRCLVLPQNRPFRASSVNGWARMVGKAASKGASVKVR